MTEQELRNLIREGISLLNEQNAKSLDVAKEKKLKKLVLNNLKGGKTIADAAAEAGVSTATFYKWSKGDGGFANKAGKFRKDESETVEVDEKKKKRGLWDNVHDKRKRGEKPAKPGDEDYPDEEAWKDAQESLEEAKSYNLDLEQTYEYEKEIGKAVRDGKLDGIDAYDKAMDKGGRTAVQDISSRITISQYGKTDNTDALKKILKKADSNLDVNTITNNFSAIATHRSKHDQDNDIWRYDIDKKINYHKAKKMGILKTTPITKMDHEVVMSLMDMMAAYTSEATPLADIQWRTLKDFMSAASDYITGSDWKKFQKDVEKRYPILESKLNEASRRKVYKAAKQGSYPAVIVVVQDGKVIHQEPVSTPDIAPATFNVMQEKYPKALLHLEDKTGKRLFTESVNEDFPGKGETVKAKYLNHEMLDYFNRMNISLSINTKSKKNIKGSVGTMFNDLVFNGGDIDKKDIVSVKIIESVTEARKLMTLTDFNLNENWKEQHGYDSESLTTIDGISLKNGMGIKQLIKLWKNDEKIEKKIGESPSGSLVNYYAKESYELAVLLHKIYKWDFEVEFYRASWNYGGHISPTYYLKGPWKNTDSPLKIDTGRASMSGGAHFSGVLVGIDISGSGYRSDRLESGTNYSLSSSAEKMSPFFEIIANGFKKAYDMPMTPKNMVKIGRDYAKLRKAWMKIWGTGGKLDKAYNEFSNLRPRRNFGITYGRPKLFPKYVKWYIDLPREFRHPDEYGGQDNWTDAKWEVSAAEEKISSMIFDFCDKYGIDATINADR